MLLGLLLLPAASGGKSKFYCRASHEKNWKLDTYLPATYIGTNYPLRFTFAAQMTDIEKLDWVGFLTFDQKN